ncbi:MAG TPA: efflux RND transporter periplasmic adaptor subunit [Pirellulales bacterium]|jgi:cobalt-zinc-cadmium efflux system membrane fusion protein|nr:efflux RND transporter periplasmic adaptor subunit [Pirellulales bacterium]
MSTTTKLWTRRLDRPAAAESAQTTPTGRGWRIDVGHAVPNLIVFSLLAGVLCLGHHTGWTMPKLAEILGTPAEQAEDWCTEHLVPESQCVECQVELLPKHAQFGFCRLHGVAQCVICHPECAEVNGPPQMPKYDTAAAIAVVARPENNSRNTLHKRRVQLSSEQSAAKAGIDVDVVQEQPMIDAIRANGQIVFDPTRVAHLSSRVAGTVAYVLKGVGEEVQAGDVLALVDAAQVGQDKAQLLRAIVQLNLKRAVVERMRVLSADATVAQRTVLEAESAFREAQIAFVAARQSLVNLGFDVPDGFDGQDDTQIATQLGMLGLPESIVGALPAGIKTANLIPVRATYEGVVVESRVVAGEVVATTTVLFTLANPRRMLLVLNLRQEDARYVATGLPVMFQTDDGSREVAGRVSWVSPAIDEKTRTLEVRVMLDNVDGKLRDKAFGSGRIILRQEPNAIVVPREAVQSTSDASFVFVRSRNYLDSGAPKVFLVRQVRVGARTDGYVELLAGVLPGEVIATKGSSVLLAQLLRSNLGAGCGCHEH